MSAYQQELLVYLERLAEQKQGCLQLLAKPKDKSAFGYGEACGILQGLDRAEQLLNSVIEELADVEDRK